MIIEHVKKNRCPECGKLTENLVLCNSCNMNTLVYLNKCMKCGMDCVNRVCDYCNTVE